MKGNVSVWGRVCEGVEYMRGSVKVWSVSRVWSIFG